MRDDADEEGDSVIEAQVVVVCVGLNGEEVAQYEAGTDNDDKSEEEAQADCDGVAESWGVDEIDPVSEALWAGECDTDGEVVEEGGPGVTVVTSVVVGDDDRVARSPVDEVDFEDFGEVDADSEFEDVEDRLEDGDTVPPPPTIAPPLLEEDPLGDLDGDDDED